MREKKVFCDECGKEMPDEYYTSQGPYIINLENGSYGITLQITYLLNSKKDIRDLCRGCCNRVVKNFVLAMAKGEKNNESI